MRHSTGSLRLGALNEIADTLTADVLARLPNDLLRADVRIDWLFRALSSQARPEPALPGRIPRSASASKACLPSGTRALWIEHSEALFPKTEVVVASQEADAGQTFSIAHEIGHILLHLNPAAFDRISQIAGPRYSAEVEEQLADKIASRLLLPRSTLLQLYDLRKEQLTGLSCIEALAERLGISLQVLAIRCDEVLPATEKQWLLLTADRDVARVRRIGFALRVRARMCPDGYFIPTNTRLGSIGLSGIAESFARLSPFNEIPWRGEVLMSRRSQWRKVRVPLEGSMKKYRTRGGYEYLALYARRSTKHQPNA